MGDYLKDMFIEIKDEKTQPTLVDEIMEAVLNSTKEGDMVVTEAKDRFSYSIALPKLVPTEAWGDPKNMDRQQINRIFSVVRGTSIKDRLNSVNKFLTPESARRKRSANVILNMMMITEALQATLNDFNESSAGFVFEAFMATLTSGNQVAGRVRGTLPIEDFVSFSDISLDDPSKQGAPVSLKLLSPKTAIKGSFTNLVDYLFVRGEPKIAYLIVYKNTISKKVENLLIFDFEISRDNLIDTLVETGNEKLLKGLDLTKLKEDISNWDGNVETLGDIAVALTQAPGYTSNGFLHQVLAGEAELEDEEETEPTEKELDAMRQASAQTVDMRKLRAAQAELNETEFHAREKKMIALEEEQLLEEGKKGGDAKSQWSISRAKMINAKQTINLQSYGELDLSQKNITELVEIYSDILGDSLQTLLETTKELTENIGRYYSESKRNRAMSANAKGQQEAKNIVGILIDDPKYTKGEK